jgi:hypothetical protein
LDGVIHVDRDNYIVNLASHQNYSDVPFVAREDHDQLAALHEGLANVGLYGYSKVRFNQSVRPILYIVPTRISLVNQNQIFSFSLLKCHRQSVSELQSPSPPCLSQQPIGTLPGMPPGQWTQT